VQRRALRGVAGGVPGRFEAFARQRVLDLCGLVRTGVARAKASLSQGASVGVGSGDTCVLLRLTCFMRLRPPPIARARSSSAQAAAWEAAMDCLAPVPAGSGGDASTRRPLPSSPSPTSPTPYRHRRPVRPRCGAPTQWPCSRRPITACRTSD
jgi:hypothetical protein